MRVSVEAAPVQSGEKTMIGSAVRVIPVAMAFLVAGCASDSVGVTAGTGLGPADNVSFSLVDVSGETVGIALVTEIPGGVFIEAEFTGLPPGSHGFHIHETGLCEPPFGAAGGHFNPTGKQHGRDNPRGAHVGDLMNLHVPESGIMTVSAVAEGATLKARGDHSLADADGSALVVHENADDNVSDPSGDAGGRIACGVIVPPRAAE